MGNYDIFLDKISKAQNIVVLTGAGISTASGIPDFRGAAGFYTKYPADILSWQSFRKDTDTFYAAFQDKFSKIFNAEPNKAHKILADWEQQGRVMGIITQNVDGLHQKAGSKCVVEYHGTLRNYTRYNSEFYPIDTEIDQSVLIDDNGVINYRKDGYIHKPNVVLFGENVKGHDVAELMIKGADLVLILGTQLQVAPFSKLVDKRKKGVPVLVINKSKLAKYIYGKVQICADITEILEKINDKL